MRASAMAAIHKRAFARQRSWTKTEFQVLLGQTSIRQASRKGGFGLLRLLPGEAEILTLAVQPEARRQGLGRLLVQELIAQATGAERVFLEVAESNQAARALYAGCGFEEIGRRPGYYAYSDGGAEDALVMQLVRQKTRPTQNPPQ